MSVISYDEKERVLMTEIISEKVIDFVIQELGNWTKSIKTDNDWKKFFASTGVFLSHQLDAEEPFRQDLVVLFSSDNMKELAKALKQERGYSLFSKLHDELLILMKRYGIRDYAAETYIHHFQQALMTYLAKNDHERLLEHYLSSWRADEMKEFEEIQGKLNDLDKKLSVLLNQGIHILKVHDINKQLQKKSIYDKMGLSFFEVDDEQFQRSFNSKIANKSESIYVVGRSREESTYRILNELQQRFHENTLIIKDENSWKHLDDQKTKGCILVPFFHANEISPISDNINIFIYGDDDICYSSDKITLRRRTHRNLVDSLIKLGIDNQEAYTLVDNTHGIFAAIKRRLFKTAFYNVPAWSNTPSASIITALLCGKWTSSEGDKLIIEQLSGTTYDNFMKEVLHFSYGESPFICNYSDRRENCYHLASLEDAWEELDRYVTPEMWQNFISSFYEVLTDLEPLFNYPIDDHFEASIHASKPEWSKVLRFGMIRTLIMRAYYKNHEEDQCQVDAIIRKLLKSIDTKERWAYISQYFTDLCEASPDAVLERLESELKTPTGMIDIFSSSNAHPLFGSNYYTNILWAIEQLLLQRKYVTRALDWLWKMNEKEIEYRISNSPRSVLDMVFCAWYNLSILSVEEKIDNAQKAVTSYSKAWEVIESKLPSNNSSICGALNAPKYRATDEVYTFRNEDVINIYNKYLKMCVNSTDTAPDKWIALFAHLHYFDENCIRESLKKMVSETHKMTDASKTKIKIKLRQIIHKHRYFSEAEWAMDESSIVLFTNALSDIFVDNEIYDYLYLFAPDYDFPLLNPVPYSREKENSDHRTQNELLMEQELTEQLKVFREKNLSLETLLILLLANEECTSDYSVGDTLARFYCNNTFDNNVFSLLLNHDKEGQQVYYYIRALSRAQSVDLGLVVEKIRAWAYNPNLIANILSLQTIKDTDALIFSADEEIKNCFWKRHLRSLFDSNTTLVAYRKAVEECFFFGSREPYAELLYELRDVLSIDFLFSSFVNMKNMRSSSPVSSMFSYYFKHVDEMLYNHYIDRDNQKCNELASLEWALRSALEWHDMICLQYTLKEDPSFYAQLIDVLYKHDDENKREQTEDRAEIANRIYSGFNKAEFCPAERNGSVDYSELKQWIEKFKELLRNQRQERLFDHFIGRLLAYSPLGEDGYMPCEAVRTIIEEYFSENLKSSYVIATYNKRGAHIVDDGKTELLMSEDFLRQANALNSKYPHTAEIYYALSASYKRDAQAERERAENGW